MVLFFKMLMFYCDIHTLLKLLNDLKTINHCYLACYQVILTKFWKKNKSGKCIILSALLWICDLFVHDSGLRFVLNIIISLSKYFKIESNIAFNIFLIN